MKRKLILLFWILISAISENAFPSFHILEIDEFKPTNSKKIDIKYYEFLKPIESKEITILKWENILSYVNGLKIEKIEVNYDTNEYYTTTIKYENNQPTLEYIKYPNGDIYISAVHEYGKNKRTDTSYSFGKLLSAEIRLFDNIGQEIEVRYINSYGELTNKFTTEYYIGESITTGYNSDGDVASINHRYFKNGYEVKEEVFYGTQLNITIYSEYLDGKIKKIIWYDNNNKVMKTIEYERQDRYENRTTVDNTKKEVYVKKYDDKGNLIFLEQSTSTNTYGIINKITDFRCIAEISY